MMLATLPSPRREPSTGSSVGCAATATAALGEWWTEAAEEELLSALSRVEESVPVERREGVECALPLLLPSLDTILAAAAVSAPADPKLGRRPWPKSPVVRRALE